MKYWKQFKLLFCCGLMVLVGTVFPVFPGLAKIVDRIIAKVNEKVITQSEVEERAYLKMMALQKQNVQPLPSMEKLMYAELERLIEERLLIDVGQKLGMKVDEDSVTKAIEEIKRNNGLKDGDLEKMLQEESKSMEEYRKKIHDQILLSRVVGYEVRKRVSISNEEIEKFYSQHQKDYWVSERLKLRHILFLIEDGMFSNDRQIKTQKAQEALQKIRSGEDFMAVAKQYSEDISASTGGDLGEIERGKMVPEFEKAAFQLKEGEVSGLVETPYGLHIIKVDKIIPGHTLSLDKVRNQIQAHLSNERLKVEYEAYMLRLKENAFIENKMPPPNQPVAKSKQSSPGNSVKQSSNERNALTDIFSPQKKKESNLPLAQGQKFSRFQTFEEKLRYYKQLRNNNKISEEEYQNMKRELLNGF